MRRMMRQILILTAIRKIGLHNQRQSIICYPIVMQCKIDNKP